MRFLLLIVALQAFLIPIQASNNNSETDLQLKDITLDYGIASPYSAEETTRLNDQESNSPRDSYALSFISETYYPNVTEKISPRLLDLTRNSSTDYAYGFIIISGSATNEKLRALEDNGIKILGYHSNHAYKAKFPTESIITLRNFPFVRWAGLSTLSQKTSPELNRILSQNFTNIQSHFPVIINLFEDGNNLTKSKLIADGAEILAYLAPIKAYAGNVTIETLEKIKLDQEVLYIEEIRSPVMTLDQSGPSINANEIRASGYGAAGPFSGAGIAAGIIDFEYHAHQDLPNLNFSYCLPDGNCSNLPTATHGTFVACLLFGHGTANTKYRGTAPGISETHFADVSEGPEPRFENGVGSMIAIPNRTDIISVSFQYPVDTSGTIYCNGTSARDRYADDAVFSYNQTFFAAVGNDGPGLVNGSPSCAKNVITVGSIFSYGNGTADTLDSSSSRGPTSDGRRKPDVVAPGHIINSCNATNSSGYTTDTGTSFSTPQVAGVAATLMQHYPWLKGNASAVKALLMSTAIQLNSTLIDVSVPDGINFFNAYGTGKVDAFIAHYQVDDPAGWSTGVVMGELTNSNASAFRYNITVPSGAKRLVVSLAWSEPQASAGASKAACNDIDLWADQGANEGACNAGEYNGRTFNDTKEYLAVDNPTSGTYQLKACTVSYNCLTGAQKIAIAYHVILGDLRPAVSLTETANVSTIFRNGTFEITTSAAPAQYMSSGLFMDLVPPNGTQVLEMSTVRRDSPSSVTMIYPGGNTSINLGDTRFGGGSATKSVTWRLKGTTVGAKTIVTYVNPSNGVVTAKNITVSVLDRLPNITVSVPSGFVNASINSTVQWTASDGDGDSLNVSCYGDTANTSFAQVATCFTNVSNSGSASCNTTSWSSGYYYVWCGADDSYNITKNYSTGQFIVGTPGAEWNLSLSTGWNFVSFKLLPSNTGVASVFSSISGSYQKVHAYNSTLDKWLSYDTSVSSGFQSLTNLSVGQAYWVLANQTAFLNLSNAVQPTSVTLLLKRGWNLFAYPYSPANVSTALSNLTGNYSKVQTYNATIGAWTTYDTGVGSSFNTLTQLQPGVGYWLQAIQNSSLVMSG